MTSFLNNLGLFLLRLVTGSLVSFFAARELANRSDIILETLAFFSIGAADIVKVFVGCLVLIFGAMLVIGFWTRFIALVLLILLAVGGYCWQPQTAQLHFQIEALYGALFFYLLLVGGGQWAVSRKRHPKGQSVLESEQSILASDSRPSIFKGDVVGESTLTPPIPMKEPEFQEEQEDEDFASIEDEDFEDDEDQKDREKNEEDGDERDPAKGTSL